MAVRKAPAWWKPVTDAEIESAAGTMRHWVDQHVEQGVDGLTPAALVDSMRDGGDPWRSITEFLTVPFNSDVEQQVAMRWLADKTFRSKLMPRIVAIASEAFHSEAAAGKARRFLLPEDDPERRTIVMVGVISIDGRSYICDRPTSYEGQQLAYVGPWNGGFVERHTTVVHYFWQAFHDAFAIEHWRGSLPETPV